MKKSRLLFFSIIIILFILFISFSGKNLILLKQENEEMKEVRFSPVQLRYTEMERKMVQFEYTTAEFQAGMNVLIYGHPHMFEVENSLTHLRRLGFNSVAINFPIYQADWQSNDINTDPHNTPTVTVLQAVIKKAHEIGFSVTLRPIMDEQSFLSSNRWRGQIQPKNPNAWFDSYQALLLTYAKLAQTNDVSMLSIGTELNSMQNKYVDRWVELIENVRHVYDGELIYSFNWNVVHDIHSNEFVNLLDHVGIDAYFPLDVPDGASVKMLEDAWEKKINEFKSKLNHPSIIVTEAGIIPVTGAYRTPYSWTIPHNQLDWEAQTNYYEATFNAWKPLIEGVYWWNITIIDGESDEMSYSPFYSPTEDVIRKQLLRGFPKR